MESPNEFEFDENEWFCEVCLGIEEVRMMHALLDYFIQTWPGAPARPVREQEFAVFMRRQMFAMKSEYMFEQDS